jgi:hypothetical protein
MPLLGCSQERKDENQMRLLLLEKQLILTTNQSEIIFNVSLINGTGRSFLLYGFKKIEDAITGENFYTKDNDITVGNALFVIDGRGNRLKLGIIDPLAVEHYKPLTFDSLKKSFIDSGETIKDSKILIGGIDTINFILSAKIESGKLEKGIYAAYLIYYCGKNIVNLVDESTIKADEKKNGAILFQGYVKSNAIRLVVE